MGQVFSKIKNEEKEETPYEILGVNELSRPSDVKKAYNRLFYISQRDPVVMERLNSALKNVQGCFDSDLYLSVYEQVYSTNSHSISNSSLVSKKASSSKTSKINRSNDPFNKHNYSDCKTNSEMPKDKTVTVFTDENGTFIKYKNSVARFDFLETSCDVFEKISTAFDIKHPPKLTDPDFTKFYNFWIKFLSDDKQLEMKVRKIVRIIRENDPRLVKMKNSEDSWSKELINEKRINVRESNTPRIEKAWKVQCTACNKGFNSKNTLRDHVKSKQHRLHDNSTESIVYNVPKEDL